VQDHPNWKAAWRLAKKDEIVCRARRVLKLVAYFALHAFWHCLES
jgi:hypothetical protein